MLLLAGCAGGTGGEELDPEKSPLTEYFSALYGDQDEDAWAKQQEEVEELVAACMTDEGFEYIPVDQDQYDFINEDGPEWGTKEFVELNGYGMQQSEEEMEQMEEQSQEYVDPNQDYVATLSESEQTAFYEVLYGPPSPETEEAVEFEYNWETAGCYGAAQHQVQGEQPYDDDRYKSLFEDMNEMYEDLQKTPEIKKADADWAECMADAGEPGFKTKQDAVMEIQDALNAVWEANPTGELDQKEELAELRERELELALVDFECAEKVDYEQRSLAGQFELEKKFIKEHKKQLDEIKANAK
jgi:hypothetical protein